MTQQQFEDQARLMLRILPFVAEESCFALKGGTAINFFVCDMPRYSVDIDLTYIALEPRAISLPKIGAALRRIKGTIKEAFPELIVFEKIADGVVSKLIVRGREGDIKIEPNLTMRGAVYPIERRALSERASE